MSNRWKVVRWERPFPTPHHRSEVIEDLGTAEDFHGPFTTHTEAMAYADRMARTITVTLPRVGRQTQIPVPEDYGNERPISVGNHGDFISAVFTAQGLTQDVAIHPEELEPLALTLLALARKEKA